MGKGGGVEKEGVAGEIGGKLDKLLIKMMCK
jgi:hypothetical protein